MGDKLTNIDFARHAAFVARKASAWAGDILSMPEDATETAHPKTIKRFTDEIREHLDFIDRRAGREPTGSPDVQQ